MGRAPSLAGFFLAVVFACETFSQVPEKDTGVPVEALQQTFDERMSWLANAGQLCQRTLKQTLPGVSGNQQDVDVDFNVAGIITSRFKQQVTRPDGTNPIVWNFECVAQLRPGHRIAVISLVMYQERGGERRGGELVTGRDFRVRYLSK